MEERWPSQQMMLKEADIHRQNTEPKPKPHNLYKNKLIMGHKIKCKTIRNIKQEKYL